MPVSGITSGGKRFCPAAGTDRHKREEAGMGTVVDYLKKYGKYSFQEMPLTEVDSLALCQLSYLKFDGMVPDFREDGEPVILKELTEHPDYEKLFADIRF